VLELNFAALLRLVTEGKKFSRQFFGQMKSQLTQGEFGVNFTIKEATFIVN
jgi:hypothetical protein